MGISEFILFQGHAIETIGMIVRALGEERVKFVDSAPSYRHGYRHKRENRTCINWAKSISDRMHEQFMN